MSRILPVLVIALPMGAFAQFSVNAVSQHHSNVFLKNGETDRDKPFASSWQWGGGASWQWKWLSFSGTITTLRMQENLQGLNTTYTYGSFGGIGWGSGGSRKASVELFYMGMRLEANGILFHKRRFNLLLGISAQGDHKFSEKQTNYSEYLDSYQYADQDAVDARTNYVYWGLGIKPRYWFLNRRLYAELAFRLNYYNQPRVINNIRNSHSSSGGEYRVDPAFYASRPPFRLCSRYISNEIGFSVGYRIGTKSTNPNSQPTTPN